MKKNYTFSFLAFCMLFFSAITTFAQNSVINGKVLDENGAAMGSASVTLKELKRTLTTQSDGTFSFTNLKNGSYTVAVSHVGYLSQSKSVSLNGSSNITFNLEPNANNLDEVVIIGYGSQKKSDLTGAVSTVSAKDFNKGPLIAADQLIQGKVSGVQIINNSGQPGGATTVKIRGASAITGSGQPLYIVDGVALDGRSSRPGQNTAVGDLPDSNPLNFINPADIASMEVLKDASATAIYGSRAAYGVVLITTKRGQSGALKVDVNSSVGTSSIFRRIKNLEASGYRDALKKYGLTTGDFGSDVDALKAVTRQGFNQNHSFAFSGGGADNKYRATIGYQDQQGIVRKSGFNRLSGSFNGNFKMLESKKLGLDINLITSQTNDQNAPITNNAGYQGSLIGQALSWNPTKALKKSDGSLNIEQGDIINPLAFSEAYNDNSRVNTVLASISPYYKIADWLEYRALFSANYSAGERRTSIRNFINIQGILKQDANLGGVANVSNNQLLTRQMTHTLSINKKIAKDLNVNAVLGYELIDYINRGTYVSGSNFGDWNLDYTDILAGSNVSSRVISSFNDPKTQLQSFFGRSIFNYKDKYIATITVRSDGSTKFGANNKYGTFPSFSVAWNLKNEEFMKGITFFDQLKIRGGWGKTGNQEFPAGGSQKRFRIVYNSKQDKEVITNENPDLKWQSDVQSNIGVDFEILKGRLSGTIDLFQKKTTDLLFPQTVELPALAGAPFWTNLSGQIINKGVEINLNGKIITGENFRWDLGANATFINNKVENLGQQIINTGEINGQGLSGVNIEVLRQGYPIFAMFTRKYLGLDAQGFSKYEDDGNTLYYVGNPNPKMLLGISTNLEYKNFSFTANLNGAFGQDIYNNTANAILPITNLGSRNIATNLMSLNPMESTSNPIAASSRYIEKGSYLKLANATFSYRFGNVGKNIKNLNIYINGQNLLIITKYSGADPEVNTSKSINGVPSAGIDYIGYPTARSFNFGINFSL